MQPRYLTKSRFKLARECPTKLYYTAKKDKYYDSKVDNDFLKALAEGGFQVGELAKLYYPSGTDIETLDYEEAIRQTDELMQQEHVIIYEAAFRHENFFIRADILVKSGNNIELIEVKSKSVDSSVGDPFVGSGGAITSIWRPYLEDISFQKYVVQKAYPGLTVKASLMLCDKTKVATVDGLNQFFFLSKVENRNTCEYRGPEDITDLGNKILVTINVDSHVDAIFQAAYPETFEEMVTGFASNYQADQRLKSAIGSRCASCEFKVDSAPSELNSGFHECWSASGISEEQLKLPLVLELWNSKRKDAFIQSRKFLLRDLVEDDVAPATKAKSSVSMVKLGMTSNERQWLQIEKIKNTDSSHELDIAGLKAEMNKWRFPLHFIDFETTTVAIPFNKGRRPYEQIAFQFSHHMIGEDGTVVHHGEWISTDRGKFPNFDFVRALKKGLEGDGGTIFRYAPHENTVLNAIYKQLKESAEVDRNELCEFIKTITKSTRNSTDSWEGQRNMVDMWDLVKKYYYDPLMKGSNSIKQVLPAVLATSDFLKNKYDKPIYGSTISSKNFQGQAWITLDGEGKLINPYKLLPNIHEELDNESLDQLLIDEESGISDGGAAMIAFARMQFTEMKDAERERVQKALLRYCELDTLAMVMIYEAWKDWCS